MHAPRSLKEKPYAFLTSDLRGTGGRIKCRPTDFIVEEIPLYEPSGNGTHLYLQIEKQGITTPEAIQRIARTAGKQPRDVGYAGLKDSEAVTRQTLSIEHVDPTLFGSVDLGRLKILSIDRHKNKLKTGHLRGNRFTIKIRETSEHATAIAQPIVDVLTHLGVPNYFGPQRFGARGDNWVIGRSAMLGNYTEALAVMLGRPKPADSGDAQSARRYFDAGQFTDARDAWPTHAREQRRACDAMARRDGDARKAWRAIDRTLRRLYLSAHQSRLFNEIVANRISGLNKIEHGDLAWKHQNGACFLVEDPSVEQPRCDAFEISPTGPIFGKRMTEPTGAPAQRETQLLTDAGLDPSHFSGRDGIRLDGARRPLRVPLGDPTLDEGDDEHGPFLRLTFSLPPGSYATCVTREICKSDAT